MSVNISLLAGAGWQFFDNNGSPLSGGLLYTYAAGTTTPQTTYTASTGSIANANPIVLDSAGRTANEIWLTAGLTYKFVLKTSVGVQIGSYDNISGANDFSSFSASSGSSLIGFIQAGSGAVATTAQAKMRERVSVKDFGAVGDGTTDDTAAIQAAINYATTTANVQCIDFPVGTYAVSSKITISGSTTFSKGLLINGNKAHVLASHNGIIFDCDATTSPGSRIYLTVNSLTISGPGSTYTSSVGMQLYGAGYYLNDVVIYNCYKALYGNGCLISNFINCTFTYSHYGIFFDSKSPFSPNDINFTKCNFIQNDRAIKVTDFDYGVVTFTACEIEANNSTGTTTDGVAVCEFSVAGEVNLIGGHFESNPGQYNIDYDSPGGRHLNIIGNKIVPGESAGSCVYVGYGELFVSGSHIQQTAGGNIVLTANTSSALVVGDTGGSVTGTLTKLVRIKTGGFTVGNSRYDTLNGTIYINRAISYGIEPGTDNTDSLGTAGLRWSTVYAGTGTINTSDVREKQQIQDLTVAERAVAVRLKRLVRTFKFNDAVKIKGDAARIHCGVIAQDVKAAFEAEGLVAENYSVLCYDEWAATDEHPAGNRYGVRYEQLFAFILTAL